MAEEFRVLGSFPVKEQCPECKGKLVGTNIEDERGHLSAVVSCTNCPYNVVKSLDEILTKEGAKRRTEKSNTVDTVVPKLIVAGKILSGLISVYMWLRPKK